MKLSVALCTYNGAKYIEEQILSILNQTMPVDEIVVCDDGSTDESGLICDEYAKQDKRIRVFHTENQGLSAARNLGLEKATGEWIGFVDSDDWIEPDMYEKLLNRILETDVDIVDEFTYKFDDNFDEADAPAESED